jgi:hypothetical protein
LTDVCLLIVIAFPLLVYLSAVYKALRSNDSLPFGQLAADSKRETTASQCLMSVANTSWMYGTARIEQEQQDTKCDMFNESYVLTLSFCV